MIGCDLVEVTASYDHAEITAQAAATMATNMICLLAEVLKQPEAQADCLERGSYAIKKGPLGALFLTNLALLGNAQFGLLAGQVFIVGTLKVDHFPVGYFDHPSR